MDDDVDALGVDRLGVDEPDRVLRPVRTPDYSPHVDCSEAATHDHTLQFTAANDDKFTSQAAVDDKKIAQRKPFWESLLSCLPFKKPRASGDVYSAYVPAAALVLPITLIAELVTNDSMLSSHDDPSDAPPDNSLQDIACFVAAGYHNASTTEIAPEVNAKPTSEELHAAIILCEISQLGYSLSDIYHSPVFCSAVELAKLDISVMEWEKIKIQEGDKVTGQFADVMINALQAVRTNIINGTRNFSDSIGEMKQNIEESFRIHQRLQEPNQIEKGPLYLWLIDAGLTAQIVDDLLQSVKQQCSYLQDAQLKANFYSIIGASLAYAHKGMGGIFAKDNVDVVINKIISGNAWIDEQETEEQRRIAYSLFTSGISTLGSKVYKTFDREYPEWFGNYACSRGLSEVKLKGFLRRNAQLFEDDLTTLEESLGKITLTAMPSMSLQYFTANINMDGHTVVTSVCHMHTHHILSQDDEIFRLVFEKAGLSNDDPINKILLPDKNGKLIYPTNRTLYSKMLERSYHNQLLSDVKKLLDNGAKESWTAEQYKTALEAIINPIKNGLKNGTIKLDQEDLAWQLEPMLSLPKKLSWQDSSIVDDITKEVNEAHQDLSRESRDKLIALAYYLNQGYGADHTMLAQVELASSAIGSATLAGVGVLSKCTTAIRTAYNYLVKNANTEVLKALAMDAGNIAKSYITSQEYFKKKTDSHDTKPSTEPVATTSAAASAPLPDPDDEEPKDEFSHFKKQDGSNRYECEKMESPEWKKAKNFKDEFRTNDQAGRNREYYRWDSKHKDIEIYDNKARYIGSKDPVSGKIYRVGSMMVNKKLANILR